MTRTVQISLVTPTLNSERFFAECLASIHGQQLDGVELQHVVVDGGSADRTVELTRGYACEVISGEDDGLYHAMNIGLARCEGDVVGVINSDDTLLPGSLATVAEWYRTRNAEWMVGGVRWTDGSGNRQADLPPPPGWMSVEMFASLGWSCIHHMTTYLTREFYARIGSYDLSFSVAADYELLARALSEQPFDPIHRLLATFRRHGANASVVARDALVEDGDRIVARYGPSEAMRRWVYRAALKIWLNGTNPRWLVAKQRGRV